MTDMMGSRGRKPEGSKRGQRKLSYSGEKCRKRQKKVIRSTVGKLEATM